MASGRKRGEPTGTRLKGCAAGIALAVPPLLAAVLVVACSTTTSNSSAFGGGGDGGTMGGEGGLGPDGGVVLFSDAAVTCSPANVAAYTPLWTAPRAHQSVCTQAQIDSYAECLATDDATSTACAPWLGTDAAVNAGCRACFADSSNTDANWGPIVDFGAGVRQLNVAGCIALATGDNTGAGCASEYEELQGCEMAGCAANCASSNAALSACIDVVDEGACAPFASAAQCASDAGAASCVVASGATFSEVFKAIAPLFCEIEPDAGTVPATDGGGGNDGNDAGGSSDADTGDGGD